MTDPLRQPQPLRSWEQTVADADKTYPKAFRIGYLEKTMEEAIEVLRVLNEGLERYPEQIQRCDEMLRRSLQIQLNRATSPPK